MTRILTCTICTGQQAVRDDRTDACVRCGSAAWLDFPIWSNDDPDEWPANPVDNQTVTTISTIWRYDGTDWVPVARRPKGPRP